MRLRRIVWKPHASIYARMECRKWLYERFAIAGRESTVRVWVIDWTDARRKAREDEMEARHGKT